jgi:hypothetical protein
MPPAGVVLMAIAERALYVGSPEHKSHLSFAGPAELLAPAQGVAQQLGDGADVITSEDLEPVARHFRVSPMVIQHQVENQLAGSIIA